MHQISKIYKWQEISVWVGCYLLGDKKIEIRTTKPVSSSWKSNQFKSLNWNRFILSVATYTLVNQGGIGMWVAGP